MNHLNRTRPAVLISELEDAAALPVEQIRDRLLARVREFAITQDDDMTLVVIRQSSP